jgi:hypothetical protein
MISQKAMGDIGLSPRFVQSVDMETRGETSNLIEKCDLPANEVIDSCLAIDAGE